jgi:hypothetical protein
MPTMQRMRRNRRASLRFENIALAYVLLALAGTSCAIALALFQQ